MGRKEKAIERMRSLPKDVTFEEYTQFLGYFDYILDNKGKTSGSRARFTRGGALPILVHNPHGHKCMWWQDVEKALEALEEEGLL